MSDRDDEAVQLLQTSVGAVVLGELRSGWWRCASCPARGRGDRANLVRHRIECPAKFRTPPPTGDLVHPLSRRRTGPNETYQAARAEYYATRGTEAGTESGNVRR